MTDAEWIIELGGGASSLANFGTWSFTKASATNGQGTKTPTGSEIYNIGDQSGDITDCNASSAGVTCKYVQ